MRMDHTYKNIHLWNHAWGFLPVLFAFLKLKKGSASCCKLLYSAQPRSRFVSNPCGTAPRSRILSTPCGTAPAIHSRILQNHATWLSLRSVHTMLRALRALRALCALCTLRALRALRALCALLAVRSARCERSARSARFALRPPRTPRCTPRALRATPLVAASGVGNAAPGGCA